MAFTLRLSEEDEQCLQQIMAREGCKTASEAVRRCVVEYLPLTSYKDEYQRIKGLYVSLLQVLEQKNQAEQALEAEIAMRLAQLDGGAAVLMDGEMALQQLKQRSLARVG
ncbi:MAG: hypothetical protein L3K52_17725 [Candidatus Thiothrix sulfatifontis]|nr:MAG: hypothetical protein L3K52_17725 [Candidatus Thiothrix sulfatifontis]